MKLNPLENKILIFLVDQYGSDAPYWAFDGIRQFVGLQFERKQIRRACRSLAHKGLAEYCRGLWTEDGEPAGAGYGATIAGRDLTANMDDKCQPMPNKENKDLDGSAV